MTKIKDERPDVDQEQPLLDFPDGDGDPDCPECKGRGVTQIMTDVGGGTMWPGATQVCKCVYAHDLKANIQRIWPVLLNVTSAKESPLLARTKRSLWITASNYDIRQHLRYVAFRKDPSWKARVFSDSSLITAWLSTAKEVFDPDVSLERHLTETPSNEFQTIVDLARPYDLLIIMLGVKAAKNCEMPNVLMEAINEREIVGKPTWVVDSLTKPIQPGHICFNEEVMEVLYGFERVILSDGAADVWTPSPHYDMSEVVVKPPQGAKQEVSPMQTGSASPYLRRKGSMGQAQQHRQEPTAAPTPSPGRPAPVTRQTAYRPTQEQREAIEAPPVVYEDDDVSMDALLADAVDPMGEEQRGSGLLEEEEEYDPQEDMNATPSIGDLGTDQLPSFLRRTLGKQKRGAALRSKIGVGKDIE